MGVIDALAGRRVQLVSVDVFRSEPETQLQERLGLLGGQLEELIALARPDAIALERVYADVNVRSVMGTAQISGVALFLAERAGIPVFMHTPTEVKAAVTGSGRANKQQVANMVARILGLHEPPKPADAADALAIAITHAWRSAGASASASTTQTPAQRAWHAAERAAKSKSEL